jgi:hypothetical protein
MARGEWDGSNVHDGHIEFLRATRRIPVERVVGTRLPDAREITPAPRAGEFVVFRSHFLAGFGLPASGFLRSFLDFYRLQPHHLTPNTVVLLAAFVTFCEGYLGVLPTLELWGRFFYLKLGTQAKGEPAQCGACVAVRRTGSGTRFPPIVLLESAKLWQKSYFYVRNLDPTRDFINLPAFAIGPPAEPRNNWGQQPPKPLPAVITDVLVRLQEMTDSEGLQPADLLAAFVQRRVSPLQARPHLICDMSGRRDPCRMSTKELPTVEVVRHVNYFSGSQLSETDWHFGKEPYSRANPPPAVSIWSPFFAHAVLFIRPDHPDAAQRFPGQSATAAPAPGHQWMADRAESDVGDPELGAAALEEDDATGGGGAGAGGAAGGGAGGGGDVRDWPDDDEDGGGQRRPEGADRTGAGFSTARPTGGAPTGEPGAPKRRAEGMFGSRPPKKAKSTATTKRQEAAKAAAIRRAPKERPMVSA